MFVRSYLFAALICTLNVLLYALSVGRYIWLEGRVRRGTFHNWGHRFRFRPRQFAQPRTEQEIVDLVRHAKQLRVCGAGHSFNDGVVTDETLVSLDHYSGILWKDAGRKQMAVRAGTRIRDINRALLREGWAFAALPSHDAQSIGGILSTDVHGTGRNWGFVSQSVVRLKIVDGRGRVIECQPGDDLFQAAIGGIGAAGVIVEVVIQAVERFNVRQKSEIVDRTYVDANLEQLLEENEHLSLYIFAFSPRCQLNTWNRTPAKPALLGSLREFVNHAKTALVAVWLADLLAHARLLPRMSGFFLRGMKASDLVLESSDAFNRTLYYPHDELEFAVPFEETFAVLDGFIELYEELYATGLPFVAFEVRFTPAGHEQTLVGAGRERRSAWINLLCNDSAGCERFLEAAEEQEKRIGARPHLGKYCRTIDRRYLQQVHGDAFVRFRAVVEEHDPEGKFANRFVQQLFGLTLT